MVRLKIKPTVVVVVRFSTPPSGFEPDQSVGTCFYSNQITYPEGLQSGSRLSYKLVNVRNSGRSRCPVCSEISNYISGWYTLSSFQGFRQYITHSEIETKFSTYTGKLAKIIDCNFLTVIFIYLSQSKNSKCFRKPNIFLIYKKYR